MEFFSDITEPGFYVYVCVHIYAMVAFVISLSYPSPIYKTTLVHFSVFLYCTTLAAFDMTAVIISNR